MALPAQSREWAASCADAERVLRHLHRRPTADDARTPAVGAVAPAHVCATPPAGGTAHRC